MRGWRDVPDDPEAWASILGWHCWRGVAGIWYGRRIGPSPTVVIRAGSLDALRALIDQWNAGHRQEPWPAGQCPQATPTTCPAAVAPRCADEAGPAGPVSVGL
jgi:hypothetical protein